MDAVMFGLITRINIDRHPQTTASVCEVSA